MAVNVYILQNTFWSIHDASPFSVYAISAYFYLLNLFNQQRWPEFIVRSDDYMRANLHISRNSYRKARGELIESNLITVTAGCKGLNGLTRYSLNVHQMNNKLNINLDNEGTSLPYNNKKKKNIINESNRNSYQTRVEQRQCEIDNHQRQSIARIQQLDERFLQHAHGTETNEDSTQTIGLPDFGKS